MAKKNMPVGNNTDPAVEELPLVKDAAAVVVPSDSVASTIFPDDQKSFEEDMKNGADRPKRKRSGKPRPPLPPYTVDRGQYLLIGTARDGGAQDVLHYAKSLRGARKWCDDNALILRRAYGTVAIYRSRRIVWA